MVVVCDGSNMKVMVISPFTNLSCQIIFLCLCSILKFSGQLMYNLPCTVKTARKNIVTIELLLRMQMNL